jgi:enoyl-CoA hydratase
VAQKIMRNSPLAINNIKSINANYKDGENGFETKKSFGTNDFKEKELHFREKKSSIYGRIIKPFQKILI